MGKRMEEKGEGEEEGVRVFLENLNFYFYFYPNPIRLLAASTFARSKTRKNFKINHICE
jgi:hypothetical protein